MSTKKLVVNVRGDDDLKIRGMFRQVGEAGGWKVQEQTGFDEAEQKMVTRQLYSQDFDDPEAAEIAANELDAAIKQISTIAIVICPR